MEEFLVYLINEGVYGIAHELLDGISCKYFIDSSELNDHFSSNEYNFIAYLET